MGSMDDLKKLFASIATGEAPRHKKIERLADAIQNFIDLPQIPRHCFEKSGCL
jgi:hypothetical protein